MDRPKYSHAPIQSVSSLSRALGITEPKLRSIARCASTLYIGPTPKPKKNGNGTRDVYDTKVPLKPLLQKINRVFFESVYFPEYLTGSLAGRDFVANVAIHAGSRQVITEDIKSFFDCITAALVCRIWREFFGFSKEVSELLTLLTTKDGRVFQGTPTSSYLANLAFWDREPAMVGRMRARGMRYSRYVDDMNMSAVARMSNEDKQWSIAQVYGMMGGAGFKPHRGKHDTLTANRPMPLMGLNSNARMPTIPAKERSATRALVFQLSRRFEEGTLGPEFLSALNKAGGKVGRLKRLHPREALGLTAQLRTMRATLASNSTTTGPSITEMRTLDSSNEPPF